MQEIMILCSNICASLSRSLSALCVTLDVRVLKMHWWRIFVNRLSSAFLVAPPPQRQNGAGTISDQEPKKGKINGNKNSSASVTASSAAATVLKSPVTGIMDFMYRYQHQYATTLILIVLSSLMSVYFSLSLFSLHSGVCVCVSKYIYARYWNVHSNDMLLKNVHHSTEKFT